MTDEVHIEAEEARSAEKSNVVRYVLALSLALAIIVMIVMYASA